MIKENHVRELLQEWAKLEPERCRIGVREPIVVLGDREVDPFDLSSPFDGLSEMIWYAVVQRAVQEAIHARRWFVSTGFAPAPTTFYLGNRTGSFFAAIWLTTEDFVDAADAAATSSLPVGPSGPGNKVADTAVAKSIGFDPAVVLLEAYLQALTNQY